MKNLTSIFAFIVMSVTVCTCASRESGERIHPYINPKIEKLLTNTAETIDFNIGYNHRYDVTYMYRVSNVGKPSVAQEREFAKILNSASRDDAIAIFDVALKMHLAVKHKVEFFEKQRDWKNYTYCKNYLLPPTEEFSAQLKKALIAKDPSFAEIEKELLQKVSQWIRWYYRYAEEPVDTF